VSASASRDGSLEELNKVSHGKKNALHVSVEDGAGRESVEAEERSLLSPECGLFGEGGRDVGCQKSVKSGTHRGRLCKAGEPCLSCDVLYFHL
jgi:hypothetical protein